MHVNHICFPQESQEASGSREAAGHVPCKSRGPFGAGYRSRRTAGTCRCAPSRCRMPRAQSRRFQAPSPQTPVHHFPASATQFGHHFLLQRCCFPACEISPHPGLTNKGVPFHGRRAPSPAAPAAASRGAQAQSSRALVVQPEFFILTQA